MPKVKFDQKTIMFFLAAALFMVLVFKYRGQIDTITPGQELRAECVVDSACDPDEVCTNGKCVYIYPLAGMCDGRPVTVYGRPSFHLDPEMEHMVGLPCSNPDQCWHWNPEAAGSIPTECCMNTGMCVVYD